MRHLQHQRSPDATTAPLQYDAYLNGELALWVEAESEWTAFAIMAEQIDATNAYARRRRSGAIAGTLGYVREGEYFSSSFHIVPRRVAA